MEVTASVLLDPVIDLPKPVSTALWLASAIPFGFGNWAAKAMNAQTYRILMRESPMLPTAHLHERVKALELAMHEASAIAVVGVLTDAAGIREDILQWLQQN